jgi:hypothetical protein
MLLGNVQTFMTVRIVESPSLRLHDDPPVVAATRLLKLFCAAPPGPSGRD